MINHPEIAQYRGLPVGAADVVVAFHDVDAIQVVWHGNYIKYFEIARCAVLQMVDYDYPQMKNSGYSWPIVDIRARFVSPATYGDRLQVVAIIAEWDIRLVIKYVAINKSTQRVIARGRSVQVPVSMRTMSLDFGCPNVLGEKIEIWRRDNLDQC